MSRFEFIFVLVSIVAGLALARLLAGLTQSFGRSNQKFDIAHVTFSLAIIVLLFEAWWATFRWADHELWTFFDFSLNCVYISMFYVIAVILYPGNSKTNPRFDEIRTRFYIAFILYHFVEMPANYVRDGSFTPWYYLPMVIHLIMLGVVGIYVRKSWYDRIFAAWYLIVNLLWPFFARFTG